MVKGECNCGAVAFEVEGDVSPIYFCHCSICRKATGTNGIPVVIFNNDAFRWVRGEDHITSWKKPEKDWMRQFCGVCGSPLPGMNSGTTMFSPAGIITEGGDNLKVEHHIWVGSKADWDEIGDAGVQHPTEFGSAIKA